MADLNLLTQIVPIDFGFGYLKGKRGERSIRQPAVIGAPRNLHEQDIRENDFIIGNMVDHSVTPGKIFNPIHFVGDLAIRKSNVRHSSMGDVKSSTAISGILMATALMELANHNEDVFLVTGLPLDFYFKQRSMMEDFLSDFNRPNNFFFKKGHGVPFEAKPVIKKSIVTLQPMGAAMKYLLDENGDFKDLSEAKRLIVVGDVGFHTFDLLVLDGMEIHRYSHSDKDISISNAYTMIQDWLRDKTGSSPDLHQLDSYILRGEYQGIDLTDIFTRAMESLAFQVKLAVESLNINYHKYISTGGWSSIITPMIGLDPSKTVAYDQDGNIDGYNLIGKRSCLAK